MWKKLTLEQKIASSRKRTIKHRENLKISISKAPPWTIISPIYLPVDRVRVPDKNYALNLNAYRNRQHHLNNTLKVMYKELMEEQLEWKVFETPMRIMYTLYRSNKLDVMNVVSVVDKFFCDALQECKCIPDDNVDHIPRFKIETWGRDKDFPRMEINIL